MALSIFSKLVITMTVLTVHINSNEAALPVGVSDAVKRSYDDIVVNKAHRYAIFDIPNDKVDVMTYGDRNANYDQFLNDIQKGGSGECRYGLYDHEIQPFILFWCPETASVKYRLCYASSIELLRNAFPSVKKIITVSTLFNASAEEIEGELRD